MVAPVSYRVERISELIRHEIILLLKQKVKDQRLQKINITDVMLTDNLGTARVFYTVAEDKKIDTHALLDKASGFFRLHLSKNLKLRHTPCIKFVYDYAPNMGLRIEDILSEI